MADSIFNPAGSASLAKEKSTGYTSVAIIVDNQVMLGRAPVTGIAIAESVDFSISKALNNKFLVNAFGDNPVQIQIQGFELIWDNCDSTSRSNLEDYVVELYTRRKLSSRNFRRVTISLSLQTNSIYEGALISLRLAGESSKVAYTYNLSFIGVRKESGI